MPCVHSLMHWTLCHWLCLRTLVWAQLRHSHPSSRARWRRTTLVSVLTVWWPATMVGFFRLHNYNGTCWPCQDMREHFAIDPLIGKRQQLLLATQLCRMVLKVCVNSLSQHVSWLRTNKSVDQQRHYLWWRRAGILDFLYTIFCLLPVASCYWIGVAVLGNPRLHISW